MRLKAERRGDNTSKDPDPLCYDIDNGVIRGAKLSSTRRIWL
jgi:hypothetical protein